MYSFLKSVFLKKKKFTEATVKQFSFFLNEAFKTPRPNWGIQIDLENDV